MYFTIDKDNDVAAFRSPAEAALASTTPVETFSSKEQLSEVVENWPIERLVQVWNDFAGAPPFGDFRPVKKFESKAIAVNRIWAAIQRLGRQLPAEFDAEVEVSEATESPVEAETAEEVSIQAPSLIAAMAAPRRGSKPTKAKKPVAIRAKKAPKPEPGEPKDAPARAGTAKEKVLGMIERDGGATLAEIMEATGWQAHTVRGFMATVSKKANIEITSSRRESDKARVYEVKR